MNLPEEDVLASAAAFLEKGLARRFGAVFDSRALGYASTLCAVDAPPDRIEGLAASVSKHPGVTHCYEREGRPNLWFTLTAEAGKLDVEFDKIAGILLPRKVLNLPATRRFKIDVVFDLNRSRALNREGLFTGGRGGAPRRTPISSSEHSGAGTAEAEPRVFSEIEKDVVRLLQHSLPLTPEPFRLPAEQTGQTVEELLTLLRDWRDRGVLRRIALVAGHRNLGFRANGMCMWLVEDDRMEAAGSKLAARGEVTHCYARVRMPEVPYNLYAMIHEKERAAAQDLFDRITREIGLSWGKMLLSVREFKKASPRFFS